MQRNLNLFYFLLLFEKTGSTVVSLTMENIYKSFLSRFSPFFYLTCINLQDLFSIAQKFILSSYFNVYFMCNV